MLAVCLEADNVFKETSVEFSFVVMASALDGPASGVSVGVGGAVDPIAIDDDHSVGHLVNEQPTFEAPRGRPGHGHVGDGVISYEGCNAMYLAAEPCCVVLVRREGKVGCVGMIVGQGTMIRRGLKTLLSRNVIVGNLDFLKTEKLRPLVTLKKEPQRREAL